MAVHQLGEVTEDAEETSEDGLTDVATDFLTDATSYCKPLETSPCKILLTLESSCEETRLRLSKQFQEPLCLDEECGFVIGDGETELAEKIEESLLHLKEGETANLDIFSFLDVGQHENTEGSNAEKQAENDKSTQDFKDMDNKSPVENRGIIQVKLISFGKVTPLMKLTLEEKLERAKHFKDLGNKLFKGGNTPVAFKKYSRAIKYIMLIGDYSKLDCDIKDQCSKLKAQCHLNIAACQLQSNGCGLAVTNCTKALEIEPTNVKALYRRSQAYKQQRDWKLALADLEKAFAIDQSNKAVQKELQTVRTKVQALDSNLAKAMSKMFA